MWVLISSQSFSFLVGLFKILLIPLLSVQTVRDTTKDEPLALQEDARNLDVDEQTCDSFEVDHPATLQDGGHITSCPKALVPASS